MAFKVKKIEFDCKKVSEEVKNCTVWGFVEIAETLNYVPTIKTNSKIEIKEKDAAIKFNRPISLNTVNNILVHLLDRHPLINIDEIEYEPKDKKVEIEFE